MIPLIYMAEIEIDINRLNDLFSHNDAYCSKLCLDVLFQLNPWKSVCKQTLKYGAQWNIFDKLQSVGKCGQTLSRLLVLSSRTNIDSGWMRKREDVMICADLDEKSKHRQCYGFLCLNLFVLRRSDKKGVGRHRAWVVAG